MNAIVVKDLLAYRLDFIDFFRLYEKSPFTPSTLVSSTSLITSTEPRRVKFERRGVAKTYIKFKYFKVQLVNDIYFGT